MPAASATARTAEARAERGSGSRATSASSSAGSSAWTASAARGPSPPNRGRSTIGSSGGPAAVRGVMVRDTVAWSKPRATLTPPQVPPSGTSRVSPPATPATPAPGVARSTSSSSSTVPGGPPATPGTANGGSVRSDTRPGRPAARSTRPPGRATWPDVGGAPMRADSASRTAPTRSPSRSGARTWPGCTRSWVSGPRVQPGPRRSVRAAPATAVTNRWISRGASRPATAPESGRGTRVTGSSPAPGTSTNDRSAGSQRSAADVPLASNETRAAGPSRRWVTSAVRWAPATARPASRTVNRSGSISKVSGRVGSPAVHGPPGGPVTASSSGVVSRTVRNRAPR